MGSVFGGLLAHVGHDVTFVDTWEENVAAINASGVRLDGVKGELRIPANAVVGLPHGLEADLAMIWTDANNTRRAAVTAAAALAEIRDLQNGIGNVETLIEAPGKPRVVAGSSMQRRDAARTRNFTYGETRRQIDGGSAWVGGLLEGRRPLESRPIGFGAPARRSSRTTRRQCDCATTGLRVGEVARAVLTGFWTA
jgi:ketopantoate reductase